MSTLVRSIRVAVRTHAASYPPLFWNTSDAFSGTVTTCSPRRRSLSLMCDSAVDFPAHGLRGRRRAYACVRHIIDVIYLL